MYEPGTRKLWTCTPGATRSGFRVPSPLDEKLGIVSSLLEFVPRVSAAPTAMMKGSIAGLVNLPDAAPLLPALLTTTMPLRQATSAACASGSMRYDCKELVPKDRFSTRMF